MTITKSKLLQGIRVVSFESRMSQEMTKLLSGFGGEVLSAPTMQEIPLEKNRDAFAFGERLMSGRIDMLICLTGVGVRALFEALETKWPRAEFVKALGSIRVVSRGPKPIKVLREYGIPVAIAVQEPNTWREILQELDEHEESMPLEGLQVALQEYGEENEDLVNGLKRRKAHVFRVPIYRWALPDDITPLRHAIDEICAGRGDILLFTNKVQIDHLMKVAEEEGKSERLRKAFRSVLIASVGPICTARLVELGISVDFEPQHSKMGSFVLELANEGPELLRKKRSSPTVTPRIRPESVGSDSETPDASAALRESRLMKALRLERTDMTPVWLMRQAGRYMKEYRDIRRKLSFVDLCKNPEVATEVTVQAQEFLDADAAIIFSDILLILEPFGLDLRYSGDEGPIVEDPRGGDRRIADLAPLGDAEIRSALPFLFEAIRLTRRALKKGVPLLGFSGAPFTLASYMIEGGASKTFYRTKTWMYRYPAQWDALLSRLADAAGSLLKLQIEAGAQAVQIFDSWAGCLGPEDYRRFAAPYTARALSKLAPGTPVINFATGNPALLGEMVRTGGQVMGIDYRIGLADAWKIVGPGKGVQGNLDPLVLCAEKEYIRERVKLILDQAAGRPGHIFNLGHGVLPQTPPDHARYLIEIVRELSSKQ